MVKCKSVFSIELKSSNLNFKFLWITSITGNIHWRMSKTSNLLTNIVANVTKYNWISSLSVEIFSTWYVKWQPPLQWIIFTVLLMRVGMCSAILWRWTTIFTKRTLKKFIRFWPLEWSGFYSTVLLWFPFIFFSFNFILFPWSISIQ